MELEVSKKVREAIKAKLLEIGCHVDDELPDYIMILIANRRSNSEIESDLSLFLADNTKKFVGWLLQVLKKLEQVTASGSAGTSFLTAPGDATRAANKSNNIPAPETKTLNEKSKKKSEKKSKSSSSDAKAMKIKIKRLSKDFSDKIKSKESKHKSGSRVHRKSESESSSKIVEKHDSEKPAELPMSLSPSPTVSPVKSSETSKPEEYSKNQTHSSKRTKSSSESSDKGPVILNLKEKSEDNLPVSPAKEEPATKEDEAMPPAAASTPVPPIVVADNSMEIELKLPTVVNHITSSTSPEKRRLKRRFTSTPVLLSASPLKEKEDFLASQNDTLILHTEENEFADNVEELRRIALESQERKRRDKAATSGDNKNLHQRKLIQNILMSSQEANANEKEKKSIRESSRIESRSKSIKSANTTNVEERRRILRSPRRQEDSDRSRSDRDRHRHTHNHSRHSDSESPSKRLGGRSPTKTSVFDRLAGGSYRSRRSRSRSRSRSPLLSSPPRRSRLSSKIGNVIVRAGSDDNSPPRRPSVSSVVKVTDRPKRDMKMSSKMLFAAVADAQKSIIQNEQNATGKEKSPERRKRKENRERISEIVEKRRFNEFPEVQTSEFYEPTKAKDRRRSIKERLGVKRDIRKSVKERLGVATHHRQHHVEAVEEDAYEGNEDDDAFYNNQDDDYNILINVSDNGHAGRMKSRNVTLATELDMSKRISIQVNNSEEDDTSDESGSSSDEEGSNEKESPSKPGKNTRPEGGDSEIELEIEDEDKLPEVPDSGEDEYVVEEVEVEVSPKGSPVQVETVQDAKKNGAVASTPAESAESSQETNFTITLNNGKVNLGEKKPSAFGALPDLRRKLMSNKSLLEKSSVAPTPAPSSLRCKYWPKCQFKDNCVYEHPACRFNPCTNNKCMYKHENPVDSSTSISSVPSTVAGSGAGAAAGGKKVCKFYPKCTSMTCKYFHPSPCRFGVGCTDYKCKSYHPGVTIGVQKLKAKGVTVIPKVNELKWVKKV